LLLIVTGRLLGEAMQRIGQPAVIGQLLAGILLGPSLLGALVPDLQHALFPDRAGQKAMIEAVSQLGILLLLLLTGMETDLRLVRKVGGAAISVSLAGVSVPFLCGFLLGWFLPEDLLPAPDRRLITSLFLGTALAISSVKIVALVVREMNFMRRSLGQVIIASAIIDDTLGWIIIALTFSLAQHGELDAASLAQSLVGTAVFLGVSLTIGRRVVFALIRWTNDNFVGEFAVISMILAIMGAMALTTHAIGVHSVLGAFIAGVLVGESPILTRHIDEQLRGLVAALFAPVFFGLAGLGTDLTVLRNVDLAWLMVVVIAIASLGKFAGAFVGGRFGGLTYKESLALACGMNARGSTEVIVASIGASMGVLSQDLFTVIVAMAVITTMAMPPTLRWALARLPMSEDERLRLEREEFESRGFVSNLERLLVAVDDGPNGRLAARLAGLIAGLRGMPITLLPGRGGGADSRRTLQRSEKTVKSAAAAAARAEPDQQAVAPIDVTSRPRDQEPDQNIAEEAGKGYDFMVIGIDEPAGESRLGAEISGLAREFDGPIAVALARGIHQKRPVRGPLDLLVPITGTEASRRAMEVAIAIARAGRGRVSALHVVGSRTADDRGRRPRARRQIEAILKDAVETAERYQIDLRTTVRVDDAPHNAILREARRGGHSLVVIGVNRRPGDTLNFGNVADALLSNCEHSLLFVAGESAATNAQARAKHPPATGTATPADPGEGGTGQIARESEQT
jgi:Kef-type K+ transport system membrane component KefB/nucleotide-binding universal stress UspA family protein